MTKPREFWIYSPNLEDDESDHCDDFVFSSKPTTSPFNKMEFFHVREFSGDEIRVSRKDFDLLKSNAKKDSLYIFDILTRIEQESK